MKKNNSEAKRAHPFFCFKSAQLPVTAILLTIVSLRLAGSVYARYTTGYSAADSAGAALTGEARVMEYRAEFDPILHRYVLDPSVLVTANSYSAVVPGMKIDKYVFVRLDGDNDVSYSLYIEICPSAGNVVSYSLADPWLRSGEFVPLHGGSIFRYSSLIPAHESGDIPVFAEESGVTVSDALRDKSDADMNSEPFTVSIYAYLVQSD